MLDERLAGANRYAWNTWLKAAAVVAIGISGFGLWLAELVIPHQPAGEIGSSAPEMSSNATIPGLDDLQSADPSIDADPRERFKQTLGEYMREVEPLIHNQTFASWDAVAQRDLTAMKVAALQAFSDGNHAAALSLLTTALEKARTALEATRDGVHHGACGCGRQP